MLHRLIGICSLLIILVAPALAGDDVPAWLRQAAAAPAPAYPKDVPAVVLLKDVTVTVGENGRITTVTNYAVRILRREGRAAAIAMEGYDTGSGGKVREIRAWLIRPSGDIKRYDKNKVIDIAGAPNDVYDETHIKEIIAEDDADTGAVFGYQSTTEERADFTQMEWAFQDDFLDGCLPTLLARYTLTLPPSWRATNVTFNHSKVDPTVNGSTYAWELRDLPTIDPEPSGPSVRALAPRLAVNYFPPPGASSAGPKSFENWTEVSRWYTELSDPQAAPDDALAAKAHELTAGAKTELERISAIGRFVQNIQYISIQIGIGRLRPHSASQVFAKQYGDCKDKANLMRAMLKAIKIQSYPVLIYSGDPTYVREEWASADQFNHCIIAIKVSDATQAATVITHPKLGRLLIFDATDDDTPVGDLPDHEQGSFALIAAGDAGSLVRMPVTPPETNRLERQAEVSLAPDGSITASVHERASGQSAVNFRREFRHLSRPDYTKMIERWVTHGATAAQLSKIEPSDESKDGRFTLDVDFTVPGYAQLMQERLLVFKPAIVSRRESVPLTEQTRERPIVLQSNEFTETVRVKLPAGFDVDELPDPTKLDTPFGTYAAAYEVRDGQLVFTRSFAQHAMTIPADQYASVRKFFERIRAAEQAPVVLAKK